MRWVDVGTQLRLVESPLDIAQAVQDKLLRDGQRRGVGAGPGSSPPPRWAMTRACRGSPSPAACRKPRCCRSAARSTMRRRRPSTCRAICPSPTIRPTARQVAALAAEGARRLGGRTMVLTTTLRALRAIGEELQRSFEGSGEVEVLVQGQWPKRRLIERFREGASPGPAGLRAGGVGFVLGRRRCARRCLAAGGHRQAAVSAAGRPAGRSAGAAPGIAGPQRLQRLLRSRSRGGAQAGRGPPDPPRIRPGRAGGLRHAPGDDGLRPAAAGRAAADAANWRSKEEFLGSAGDWRLSAARQATRTSTTDPAWS